MALNLVVFDQQGLFGPAATLAVNANCFNKNALKELTQHVAKKYFQFTKKETSDPAEFCAQVIERQDLAKPMSTIEILATPFFESLLNRNSPPFHQEVINYISESMLKTACKSFPALKLQEEEESKFKMWIAGFVESYVPEKTLQQQCQLFTALGDRAQTIIELRKEVGEQIYAAAASKNFSEQDLNVLLDMLNTLFDLYSSIEQWNTLTGATDDKTLAQILPLMGYSIVFQRLKDRLSPNIQTLLNEETLNRLQGKINSSLGKATHPDELINFFQQYTNMFGFAGEEATKLKVDLCTLFDTVFRNKFFPKS